MTLSLVCVLEQRSSNPTLSCMVLQIHRDPYMSSYVLHPSAKEEARKLTSIRDTLKEGTVAKPITLMYGIQRVPRSQHKLI